MRVSRKHAMAVALLAPWLVTCSTTIDQTISARFFVSNRTSQDVIVEWGLKRASGSYQPVTISAGGHAKLHEYSEFLGAPPDAAVEFSCLSVYRVSDGQMVLQLAPVTDEQWLRLDAENYRTEYILFLTDNKLKPGVVDACSRLSGVAIDSVTSASLDGLNVSIVDGTDPLGMRMTTGLGNEYSFMWVGDLPEAEIRFFRLGYQARQLRLPDDATDLGDRRYQLNPSSCRDRLSTNAGGRSHDRREFA